MVLVDMFGIYKFYYLLGEWFVKSVCSVIGEVDFVVLLLEGCECLGCGDVFIVNLL